jgi:uncharacterized protein (TIGR03435 family)
MLRNAVFLVAGACALHAQTDASPKFEVASVKQTAPGARGRRARVTPGGGFVAENATVRQLIEGAYSVQDFQISGGPSWLQTEGYSIDAKSASEATPEQVYRMLQSLLAERFHLQIRRETHDGPVYNLVVAKGGSKLLAVKDSNCVPDTGAPITPRTMPCGRAIESLEAQGAQMVAAIHGSKVTLPELTRALSRSLGRPAIDKTGFTDAYDLALVFTPDDATVGIPTGPKGDPGRAPAAAEPGAAPSIFAAIQEQLGLRLEAGRGPVDTIVIEHVERPAEN